MDHAHLHVCEREGGQGGGRGREGGGRRERKGGRREGKYVPCTVTTWGAHDSALTQWPDVTATTAICSPSRGIHLGGMTSNKDTHSHCDS